MSEQAWRDLERPRRAVAAPPARRLVAVDEFPAALYLLAADAARTPIEVSSGFTDLTGYDPEDWLADPLLLLRLAHPDDRMELLSYASGLIDRSFRLIHRGGHEVRVRERAALRLDERGRASAWEGFLAPAEGADSRLGRRLLERLPLAAALVDDRGALVACNDAVPALFGYPLDEASGPTGLQPGCAAEMERLLTGRRPGTCELTARRRGGEEFAVEIGVGSRGDCGERVVIFRDLTEQRRRETCLTRQALYDPESGLPNRVVLLDRLEHGLSRLRRRLGSLAVLLVDLANGALLSDGQGSELSAQFLGAVTGRLRDSIRPGDTLARLAEYQFVIALEDVVAVDDAVAVAERTLAALRPAILLGGQEFSPAARIGIAVSSSAEGTALDLLRDADAARTQAAPGGYAVFDPGAYERTLARLARERDLRHALAHDDLRVYFQPIVAAADGRIRALEAFVYWDHAVQGVLAPDEFAELAESAGLMPQIGLRALEEAAGQVRAWGERFPCEPPLSLAINLSLSQLRHSGFVAGVEESLRRAQFDPARLTVEVIEPVLAATGEAGATALAELAGRGVRLALDGFGASSAALAPLRTLPFSQIKLDAGLMATLVENPGSQALVQGATAAAGALGIETVARGIDDGDLSARARELGCQLMQGTFIAPPNPSAVMETLLHFVGRR